MGCFGSGPPGGSRAWASRIPCSLPVSRFVLLAALSLLNLFLLGSPAVVPVSRAQSPATPADPSTDVQTPSPADTLDNRAVNPPTGLTVIDRPNDAGNALRVAFKRAPGDSAGAGPVVTYDLYRSAPGDTGAVLVRSFAAEEKANQFSFDDTGVHPNRPYSYFVRSVASGGRLADTETVGPAMPRRQWFLDGKLNTLITTVIFVALVLGFIRAARKGATLFIRRIAGLDAIDEAVGRCTEMGKPTLYIPGISSMSDVATIASINILGQVAKKIASYQSRILVPNRDPIVYPITQDVVKQGFLEAGYPDAYHEDDVYFVTSDQFAYAAAVCGTMVREKPGANLLLGMFFAEALILAETGASVGAIQIAGTDAIAQLPFFVTACDYTIIGEELYAASAYISREPTLLGSLKGQDYFKIACIALIVLGVVTMTAGVLIEGKPWTWIQRLVQVRGG